MAAACLFGAAPRPAALRSQPQAAPRPANHDPARAEIVTRDVHNFWRAYDERAPDKRRAVREIFAMPDPQAFVAASGYAP